MTSAGRRVALVTAALAGAVVGVVVTMTLTDPGAPSSASGDEVGLATTRALADPDPPDATTATTPIEHDRVLLVWTSGGLAAGLADQVRLLDGVARVSLVRGDEIPLTASMDRDGRPVDSVEPGWHIPLDALAVDPVSFSSFLQGDAADLVRSLLPGQVLLTQTSAELRRLTVGATLDLAGERATVAGIIDDVEGAGAELLVTMDDAARVGVTTDRYLLVAHRSDRSALQRAIADLLDGRAVRFRSPAETTWLRHGDAVAPPAMVKATYGEFAMRDQAGRAVEVDPRWIAGWIVTEPVPILGLVTCHRLTIEPLRAAMTDLEAANLAHLVDPADFAGCFAPRRIADDQPLSHHAWGAALDLNVDGNPRGSFSTQDARLVEIMARHGFTWGGTWLVPDPAHYDAPVPPP